MVFPSDYEEIRSLYRNRKLYCEQSALLRKLEPAVDGNVLRDYENFGRRFRYYETKHKDKDREDASRSDSQRGPAILIKDHELGAIVCVPNGEPNAVNVLSHIYAEQGKKGESVNFRLRRKQRQDA